MKKTLIITLAGLALLAACTQKTRHFGTEGSGVQASCTYSGADSTHATWQFTNPDGTPLVPDADSLRVVERGPAGHPMTVCFHIGPNQRWLQFYSNMQLRSDGMLVGGVREGLWTFYYPNGVPYFVGQCRDGRRVGTWEVYDPNGNLATTQDYGD